MLRNTTSNKKFITRKKKLSFFLIIVVGQLILIIFLLDWVQEKKENKVLGEMSVNPIREDYLDFPKSSKLEYFYEPKPNATEREQPEWLDHEAVYTINSDSLNERYDYDIEKPENTFRIITVGDSHTFGLFVDTKDNYPEQLESMLNTEGCFEQFEVINLGVAGYDPEYVVERFKRRGVKYQPDLIVYLVTWSDLFSNEMYFPIEEEIKNEVSTPGEVEDYKKEYGIWYSAAMAWERLRELHGEDYLVADMTEKIGGLVDVHEGKVILSVYEDEPEVIKDGLVELENSYASVFFHNNIKHSDMEKLPDGHPTKEDYTKHAESFLRFFFNNGIITCQ